MEGGFEAGRLFEEARPYGLEERTFVFAEATRVFIRTLPRTLTNVEDAKQLTRSSGSIGANFIEAVEALSDKDFVYRLKICRKEAKESRYWLRLVHIENPEVNASRQSLIQEAQEILQILSSIIAKHQRPPPLGS